MLATSWWKCWRRLASACRRDCWLDNAVICRPADSKGDNRKPSLKELEYCRPHLSKTLSDLKPDVIIPMGGPAIQSIISLAWKPGEVDSDNITKWVGWQIPCQRLNAWICPTYHPSFLLHDKDAVAEMFVARHLIGAFELEGKPWKVLPDYRSQAIVEMNDKKAAKLIEDLFYQGCPIAFDYETTTLKPDGPHMRDPLLFGK